MTEKKANILNAALDLFSKDGYDSSSTSAIAKKAGVSEGLIFRHFKNKEGLLNVLAKEAEALQGELLIPILFETSSKKVIRRAIKLPFKPVNDKEVKLLMLKTFLKCKPEYDKPDKMNALIYKLTVALRNLKYKDPENEARLLYQIMDSISLEILRGNMKEANSYRDFLLKKYKVD